VDLYERRAQQKENVDREARFAAAREELNRRMGR
jgi:hypothetical protein